MINGFKQFPNYITNVPEERYEEIDSYIQMMEALSRITKQPIYLVDFFKGESLYISSNPLFLGGKNVEEVKEMGRTFTKKMVSEKDSEFIFKILKGWFHFLEEQPAKERTRYSLRYDYYLEEKLLSVTMTPVFLCKEYKPWIVLCTAQISTNNKNGNAVTFKHNTSDLWRFCEINFSWQKGKQITLTDIEQTILRLSIQGKKEHEICNEIFRSKDGLKSIKRRMFQKMEVNNITEAVSRALSFGLL